MPVAESQKRRSRFWYLFPIFLQIIGGLIAYFALRKSNSTVARNALYVGIILSAATTAVVLYLYSSYHNDIIIAARERVKEGSLVINTVYGPIEYAKVGVQNGYYPVLLVIHGAGGGYDQGIILSRVFLPNDYLHVIAPSRFGFLHTPISENASPAAQADAYAALLDKLNITTKVAIVGISAGGPSTLEFALRHPDRTLAVVLISAVVHREPPMGFMDKVIHYVIFKSDFIFWLIGKYFEPNMISFFGVSPNVQSNLNSEEKRWLSDVVIPSMQPISQRQPGMLNDRINFSFLNYSLNKITVPTLLINAKDDTLVNSSHSEYAAQNIPGAKHITFNTGGHLLLGDQQKTKAAVTEFLMQHISTK